MLDQLRWFWLKVHSYRRQAVINVLLGILLVLADFAFIFVSKEVIDTATGSQHLDDSEALTAPYSLTTLAVVLLAIVLLQITLRVAHRWVTAILGVRAQNLMQQQLFRTVLDGAWQGRERRHTGDIVNRLETDVRTIVDLATEKLPQITVVLLRLVGAFVFLFTLDSWLAICVVIVLPLFILLSRIYFRKMRRISREIRNTDSRVQSVLQEYVQHHLVVKTLQRSDESVKRLSDEHETLRHQIRKRTLFGSFSMVVVSLGFSGVYLITFLWGAYQLHHDLITYGTLIAFVQLVAQIQMPFRELTRFVPSLINAFTSIERLMQLEGEKNRGEGEQKQPRITGKAQKVSKNAEDCQETSKAFDTYQKEQALGVRLTDVTFRYSPAQRIVLENASFDFAPGTVNAIVGHTGAGKTTIVRLILALIKPQTGKVEIYGKNGVQLASEETRSQILYVPQGNTLLSGTIRDNLLFGNPTASDEEMREALHTACADFVFGLKHGLDTTCGELGNGLSEGQAQRIAIARSLLHGGNILLLDEVTSALDLDTERELLNKLCNLAQQGRTLIFITHRQEVLQQCDQVVEMG